MKNIVKISFAALSAALLMTACIEETFPTSVATNEQIAKVPSALAAQVNGMAAFVNNLGSVSSSYAYDWGYPSIGLIRDVMCEDIATVSSGYEWYSRWMENTYQGDSYVYGQFIWNFYTKFLLTANSVIGAFTAEPTNSQQAAYLAMAYCYRALINLDMGRMYEFKKNNYTTATELEGLTIPIITPDLTEEQSRNNPRVSKNDLLSQMIIPDLEKAAKLFGEGTSSVFKRTKMNEPNLSVAYGLLARAYMWAEDYAKAAEYAQKALDAGSYSPLTESQWTDTKNGFNNATSQKSWMWASMLTEEDNVVKTGILNWTSWISSETSYGYVPAGPYRLCDARLYNSIPDSDFRKKSWNAPSGSSIDVPLVASTSSYDQTTMPELAVVKFRPGSGNPDDYKTGSVVDYCLMRCEEMYFILAECAARKGDKSVLESFMKSYRDASYACTASDLVSEVILQKRIEFWGEGIIFFDYKRLNMPVVRGYAGTNHYEETRLNTEGLAPWMNLVVVRSEHNANQAFITNPDPSGLVDTWSE